MCSKALMPILLAVAATTSGQPLDCTNPVGAWAGTITTPYVRDMTAGRNG